MKNRLIKLIQSGDVKVAVIGLGYVGLPLAVGFAEKGIRVIGLDTDPDKISSIVAAEESIVGIQSERIVNVCTGNTPSLTFTTNYDALKKVDAAIICVPTPLKDDIVPDLSFVELAAKEISKRLHDGMLIILESTTYPGTTEELLLDLFQSGDSSKRPLKIGKNYFLAFSPERIDPGRTDYTIENTPKVVGGVTEDCTEVSAELYRVLVDSVVQVSSPKAAEMVKLLENTYRSVNIGLANEFALICDALGVDVWEVIEAASTKPFGYTPFYPGPGLGGHCIPVDPQYLAWKMKQLALDTKFINLATEINQSMCEHVVSKIVHALNLKGKSLTGAKILVLGVAYKNDVADIRESPGIRLIDRLIKSSALVSYHDTFVPQIKVKERSLDSLELTGKLLSSYDCVVITTAHSYYPIDLIVDESSIVVDTRNATSKYSGELGNVIKL